MTKPRFETSDLTAENIEKIAVLFPSAITEALDEEKSTPEKKVYKNWVWNLLV
jgi:adenine-specific DNA-methyltransferase